jgi:4-hydroxy-tetrahydrodipicolinate synthase
VPYYNRPTQEGLFRHFVEVARSVRVPVVVYNVPARTGSDLAAETLARITEAAPNVVATKEATGNVLRAQQIVRTMGARMTVLCGDDALTLAMCAVGARGVISVTSNLLPAEVTRATRLVLDGNLDEARKAHLALLPVHEAMFLESNPSPLKTALAMRGVLRDVVRSPLASCTEATKKALAAVLETYGRGAR